MEGYSIEQRVQIIKCYYQNLCSVRQTFRALRDFYPRHKRPAESTIRRLVAKFEAKGSIINQPALTRRRNARSIENIAAVSESVRKNPNQSLSRRSQELGLSATSVWRIMRTDLGMEETKSSMTWGTTWLVITGASRGLGAGICEGFAPLLGSGSVILGLARSSKGLEETAAKVKAKNSDIQFVGVTKDLTTCHANDLESILKDNLESSRVKFERLILVHNAGSLGNLDYLAKLEEFDNLQNYYGLNLSSVITLNAVFLRLGQAMTSSPIVHIINVSSLCALTPMKSWGLYCSAKAARDMLFKVLAKEETSVRVLNYAPGPLDTDMQIDARTITADPEVRALFDGLKKKEELVQVKDSVEKLVQILCDEKYSSGDHIDYYD